MSLDSLACLVILMRESAEANDLPEAQKLAHAVQRMLLLMAQELRFHGIALPLADYLDANVLPAIPGFRLCIPGFLKTGERLAWLDRLLQPRPAFESKRTRARILQVMLDGPRRARSPWCRIASQEAPHFPVE